jgi:ParB family chromosome partitioning protein
MSRPDLRQRVAVAFATGDDQHEPVATPEALSASGRPAQLRTIPLDLIRPRPDQPRRSMDEDALEELARSIAEHGVLQPIRVRRREEGFEIIAGERRWTAARRAGLQDIPAVVADADDDEAFIEAVIENIQREDLNPVDRGQALRRLRVKLGLGSWEDVARVVGITRRHVYNLLNITRLPGSIQEDVRVGGITEKHARALLRLGAHPARQLQLWERIHAEELSGEAALELATHLRPTRVSATRKDSLGAKLADAVSGLWLVLDRAEPAALAAMSEQLGELHRYLGTVLAAPQGDRRR